MSVNTNKIFFLFLFSCCCYSISAQNCVNGQTYSLSQNGPYQVGDVVEVSYTINNFQQINYNWIIAIEVNLGNGWENLTPLTNPGNPGGQSGNWIWDNQNTFPSGLNFGPGWRFVPSTGNPNYGTSSTGPFTMSFEVTVSETCTEEDLSISVQVYGDCQTGGWNGGFCCDDNPLTIYNGSVNVVSQPPFAGTNGNVNICASSDPINLFESLGNNPDENGSWAPQLTNGFLGNFDPNINSTGLYTYSVSNECGSSSANVYVNVVPETQNETTYFELCSNAVTTDLYGELGINNSSGDWSGPVPLYDSPAPDYFGLFNPQEQISGTYNYTFAGSNGCDIIYPIEVNVIQFQANSGLGNNIVICESNGIISLYDELLGNPDQNGFWSPQLDGSYLGSFDPSLNTAGEYVYSVSDQCGTSTATIIIDFFEVVSISTVNYDICNNASTTNLYGEISANNNSGDWSGPGPLFNSPAPDYLGLFNPQDQIAGLYTYSLNDENGCLLEYPINVSIISSLANAGDDALIQICDSDDPINLFEVLVGNPDIEGVWSPSLSGGYLGTFNPASNLSGTYTYTVNDDCGSDNSEVEISVTTVTPPSIISD